LYVIDSLRDLILLSYGLKELVKEAKKALLNDKKWLSIKRAMETSSRIIFGNSNKMDSIDSESVDRYLSSVSYDKNVG